MNVLLDDCTYVNMHYVRLGKCWLVPWQNNGVIFWFGVNQFIFPWFDLYVFCIGCLWLSMLLTVAYIAE